MASSFNNLLNVEEIGTGEQAGSWGVTTNTNLATTLSEAITGRATVTILAPIGPLTLSYVNSNSSQAVRNLVLNVISSGNLTGTSNVIVPNRNKQYIVENNTSGGQSIVVKTSAGTGVTIPAGKTAHVFCDGTNVRFAADFVGITGGTIAGASISGGSISGLSSALGVTSGGTGLNSATQGGILYASASNTYAALPKDTNATRYLANTGTSNNPAWAQINLTNGVTGELPALNGGTGLSSPGTAGNVLTSNGTAWVSQALPTAFVTGMIMLWSGTIATIPAGWVLCDGTNSTPDLRDRFIIGARQDSGGTARTNVTGSLTQTGGSKDSIVVSHNHTYSGTTGAAGGHNHTVPSSGESGNVGLNYVAGAAYFAGNTATSAVGDHQHSFSGTTASTGSSGTNANLPPYYALAFIMKT